jgi:hypothetical protein
MKMVKAEAEGQRSHSNRDDSMGYRMRYASDIHRKDAKVAKNKFGGNTDRLPFCHFGFAILSP